MFGVVVAASLLLAAAVRTPVADARVTVVTSISALQAAIDGGAAGDVVQLADGTYRDGALTIGRNGVTVEAQTTGGVTLTGTVSVAISASDAVFRGFRFTGGSNPGAVITVTGDRNVLTELSFDGYSAQKYVVLAAGSQYGAVTWSNFANKPTSAPKGNLVHIDPDPIEPGYHVISHNSFQHLPGAGGDNGNEPIRIGNGAQSTYSSRTIVEFNHFEDTGAGDSEAISVKSRDNVLRWNTVRNNPDAMFVMRNGDSNVVYGNFFIRSGGIRVVEANDIWIHDNHFEFAGVGGSMHAFTYDSVSPNLTNVHVIHNTFYEPDVIDLAAGGTSNTWADNLFVKTSGNLFAGVPSGIRWTGNLYRGTLGSVTANDGLRAVSDPGLTAGPNGFRTLVAGSPAIDAATTDYPAVRDIPGVDDDPAIALDVEGQARPADRALKDVGADEFSTGATTNRPLSVLDVGPSYLRSGSLVGAVTDGVTGIALSGAAVAIDGGAAIITDGAGRYRFSGLAPAAHTVVVSRTGYVTSAPASVLIAAGATTTRDLMLQPSPPATTAWVRPTQSSAVTSGAGDNNGFETGRANIFASDGVVARDANSGTGSGTSCTSTTRDRENLAGFAIPVPAGASIRGLEVQVRARVSSKSGTPRICVRLSTDSGLTWTAGRITPDLSTSLVTHVLGSSTDLWGRSWSTADLGPGLRVQIIDLSSSTARTFEVDAVAVRITT